MESTIDKLMSMQMKLNSYTCGDDWFKDKICKNSGRPMVFELAGFLETSELIDSLNWKHWKDIDSDDNIDNLVIEYVDILHFIMSIVLIGGKDIDFVSKVGAIKVIDEVSKDKLISDAVKFSKSISIDIETHDTIHTNLYYDELITAFVNLTTSVLSYCKIDFNEIVKIYTSKNALNIFRVDNGYKDGTYIKTWNGQEDNEVLMGIVNNISGQISIDDIYHQLSEEYKKVN